MIWAAKLTAFVITYFPGIIIAEQVPSNWQFMVAFVAGSLCLALFNLINIIVEENNGKL